MTKDHMRVHAIFDAACDMSTVDRSTFLDRECNDDKELREEVESLLKHHFTSARTAISEEKVCDIAVDHQLGDIIDGYRIINILGEGGMGIVYLAGQSTPVRRKVALKIVKAGMDTKQVIARFEAERQALAIMHHSGIAQVYDAGVTKEGRPYFVLEYVEGKPITEACDIYKLKTNERLELMAKVCDAIQHAHSKGVIHRDLKPSNIMVTMNDKGVLEPKIIDFGVAKATSGKLTDQTFQTQVGRFVGTPAYMSPEQADMKASGIDTRTDVYALGVVLYELLTGRLPFDPDVLHDSGFEKMRDIICGQDPPRPSTHISSLDAVLSKKIARARQINVSALASLLRKELEWIPLKALRKSPDERYDSAKNMADDLRRYIKGEPLAAGPESTGYRLKKTIRRNKGVFAAVVTIVLLLIAGIAVSTNYALDARKEKMITIELLKRSNSQLYVSHIHAATAAVQRGDLPSARRRLVAACQVKGNPSYLDLPFEWKYLSTQSQDSVEVLDEHKSPVRVLAASPDHSYVASCGWDGTIFIRDANNGAVTAQLDEHRRGIHAAVFSPDSKLFASCGVDQTARLWDVKTGTELFTLTGHTGGVWDVAFNSDGSRLVTCSDDNTIRIWDTRTGEEVMQPLQGHTRRIMAVAFSPNDFYVLSCSADNTMRLWNADSGLHIKTFEGHEGWVNDAIFLNGGSEIISCSEDNTLRVWSIAEGNEIRKLSGHSGGVLAIDLSDDGNKVATASRDKTVGLWDITQTEMFIPLEGHRGIVTDVAYSPDGKTIVSCSDDGTVKSWNAMTGKEIFTFEGHINKVHSIVFGSSENHILSASEDGTVCVWNPQGPSEHQPLLGHTQPVVAIEWSPDGNRFVSVGQENQLFLWDTSNGNRINTFKGHTLWVNSAVFSPDGTKVVSGSSDGSVRIWDAQFGIRKNMVLEGHTHPVNQVVCSPDGMYIASCSFDKTIRLWSLEDGKHIDTLNNHIGNVTMIAFSPRESLLISGGSDGVVYLWNLRSGESIPLVGHEGNVLDLIFSHDGSKIASAGADNTIRIWDATDGKVLSVLTGHDDDVTSIAFNQMGNLLCSGSKDHTIRLWDLESSSRKDLLVGHESAVQDVSFHQDGNRILSASADSTVRVWDVESGEEMLALIGHKENVRVATWSPDGERILSCGDDKTIRLWESQTRQLDEKQKKQLETIVRGWVESTNGDFTKLGELLESELPQFPLQEQEILRMLIYQHSMRNQESSK